MGFRYGIFEIRPETFEGPTWQRDAAVQRVVDTLDACSFPWWRCIPALKRVDGPPPFPFPIDWKSSKDTSGWAGYVSRNHMWLTEHANVQTIAHELAHVADLMSLGHSTTLKGPVFNTLTGPYRRTLLDLATFHGEGGPTTDAWMPSGFNHVAWEFRPVEAFTVPWTRIYFKEVKYHYPVWRFAESWQWPSFFDEITQNAIEIRRIQLFKDQANISQAHLDNVLWLAERDLVRGDANGNFNPHSNITREQLASVMKQGLRYVIEGGK
jgi:hypothetical protein